MAQGADGAVARDGGETNPAPAQLAAATFILREVAAIIFVVFWLGLFTYSLLTEGVRIPLWFHGIGVGVLAYALGLNVASLTSFRPTSRPLPGVVERVAEG